MEGMSFSIGRGKKTVVKGKKKPFINEKKNQVPEQIPIKAHKEETSENAKKENTAAKLVASKKKRGN